MPEAWFGEQQVKVQAQAGKKMEPKNDFFLSYRQQLFAPSKSEYVMRVGRLTSAV
jgi:hypothetical protein